MPLKGRDTSADRPRNELEGEEEEEEEEKEKEKEEEKEEEEEEEEETVQTLQYSQVHHSGTARPNSVDGDDGEFGSVEEDGDEDVWRPATKRRLLGS